MVSTLKREGTGERYCVGKRKKKKNEGQVQQLRPVITASQELKASLGYAGSSPA